MMSEIVTLDPADITGKLAVLLGIEQPEFPAHIGMPITEKALAPRVALKDARWYGSDLYITLANGERFQATFVKVDRFPHD
jgi:hypothetical protein